MRNKNPAKGSETLLAQGEFGTPKSGELSAVAAALLAKEAEKSANKPKRKRPKFIRKVTCQVCGDVANDHIHYGAIACYSCRAFFRRSVNANAPYFCSQGKNCVITKQTRKHCQYCRYQKCLSIGMKGTWVMTEDDKREKKEKALLRKLQKLKREDLFQAIKGSKGKATSSTADEMELSDVDHLKVLDAANGDASSVSDMDTLSNNGTEDNIVIKAEVKSATLSTIANQPMPNNQPNTSIVTLERRSSASDCGSTSNCGESHTHSFKGEEESQNLEPIIDEDLDLSNLSTLDLSAFDEASQDDIEYITRMSQSSNGSPKTAGSSPNSSPKRDVTFLLNPALVHSPNHDPVMPFTSEEKQLVTRVISTEMSTTKAIPVNPQSLMAMIQAAKTGATVPYGVLLDGYTTCMKRIIKMASKLDFFQSLCQQDQRNLLLNNTDMIVNIRSARLLRPKQNLQVQLEHVVGSDDCTTLAKYQPASEPCARLNYQQVFQSPWACNESHEKQFASLMENIFNLEMDQTTTMLMSMIVLFSTTNPNLVDKKRCSQNQEFFTYMLHRYLSCTVGKVNATRLMPKYMYLISQLEEMAQIMISKRLLL